MPCEIHQGGQGSRISHAVRGRLPGPLRHLERFLPGHEGTMLDMYRRPEKVVAACEKLLPFMIEMAVNGTRATRESPGVHPDP